MRNGPVTASCRDTCPLGSDDSFAAGRNKAKRAKYMSAIAPLQEGEELTDTTGRKWTLGKRLSESTTELVYEGENENHRHLTNVLTPLSTSQTVSRSSSKESNHILKLVRPRHMYLFILLSEFSQVLEFFPVFFSC